MNLPRGDGQLLVVPREYTSFLGEFLEDFVDKVVHYPPCLTRDAYVKVHLL